MTHENPSQHVTVSADVRTPISMAVTVTLVIVTLVVVIFAAIGGSYLLTLNQITAEKRYEAQQRHKEAVAARQLAAREAVSNLRSGIPTCKAIVQMDHAQDGAVNASHSPNSYGHRLAKAIHNVAEDSHCTQLVYDLNHGWSLSRILAQQEAEAKKDGSAGP